MKKTTNQYLKNKIKNFNKMIKMILNKKNKK